MFRRFADNESGATAIEYGLIVVVLSLAIVGGVSLVANEMTNMMTDPARALQTLLR